MPVEDRAPILKQMEDQSPNLHQLILQKVQVIDSLEQKPLPEKAPPRRSGGVI